MKLACETILREARNDKVVVQERTANGKVYCTTHINFETSTPIHDTFENVCRRYNIDMSMTELLKQADKRSAAQDAINNREDSEKLNTFEKEINTMNENTYTNEDYIIKDKITSNVMNYVCTTAIDYDRYPVDLGFKLNNLNASEFKLYAKLLMRYAHENPFSVHEYSEKKLRDQAFYNFRDKNKHLIDDTRTAPVPTQSECHIPTQFEIKAKNNCEWKDLQIAYLTERLNNAADCYKFMEAIILDYESKQPKRRKTSVKK